MSRRDASGAISSKIRAMYGRRLTPRDFDDMLASGSVAGVAEYLRSRPAYSAALSGMNVDTVGRREFEDVVRRARFADFERLCRYGLIIGESVADYLISYVEVETLVRAVYGVAPGVTDRPPADSYTGSDFLDGHLSFSPAEVFAAKDVPGIAEAASGSRFSRILCAFPENGGAVDAVRLCVALRAEFLRGAVKLFEKSAGSEAAAMLKERIDLECVVTAYRLKKYFGADAETVSASLIGGGDLGKASLLALAEADEPDAVIAVARRDRATAKAMRILDECRVIDEAPERAVFRRCCRMIRLSSSPAALIAAYFHTAAVECANIVKVIEGKRYGIPSEEIKRMLILEKYEGEEKNVWRSQN